MPASRRVLGRYELHGEIGSGGMASVHLGRLVGPAGFSRTVAIKRLLPRLAENPDFVAMFMDEARMASRVRHPNVVDILELGQEDGELFLVMDYVHGVTLAHLIVQANKRSRVPPAIAVSLLAGALRGLHAAHEAKGEKGVPLDLVHRDFSPQNVLVGADGMARVLDFGVAKAVGRLHTTRDGSLKGKASYMAREHLLSEAVDRRADIYSAAVVLWETLTGHRLFQDGSRSPTALPSASMVPAPSQVIHTLPVALDAIVKRGLADAREDRFATAAEMAAALEDALAPATPGKVADFVAEVAGESLAVKAKRVAAVEEDKNETLPPISTVKAAPPPETTLPAAPPMQAFALPPEVVTEPAATLVTIEAPPPVPTLVTSARAGTSPPMRTLAGEPIDLPVSSMRRTGAMAIAVALVGVGIFLAIHFAGSGNPAQQIAQTAAPAVPNPSSSAAPAATMQVTPGTAAPSSTEPASSASHAPIKPPPSNRCNPPYRIDERGIKHPKPECY